MDTNTKISFETICSGNCYLEWFRRSDEWGSSDSKILILFCYLWGLSVKEKKAEIAACSLMDFGISFAVYKPHTFFEVMECLILGSPESRALSSTN